VPIFNGLSKRFRVLAPDRLGNGMTENPKGDYNVTAEVEHLYGFLKALGVERFHVMGQSTGAYHAARITLEHPEMVKTDGALRQRDAVAADRQRRGAARGDRSRNRRGRDPSGRYAQRTDAFFAKRAVQEQRAYYRRVFGRGGVHGESAEREENRRDPARRSGETLRSRDCQGAEEMRGWIKQGRLQTPTLLYWGKNDPSAISPSVWRSST